MNDLELPTEIIYDGINDDVDLSNWEELIDYIVERLSETYGFLVESLSTEIIDEDKGIVEVSNIVWDTDQEYDDDSMLDKPTYTSA